MFVAVFIDSCAVNRFALSNVDPSRELAGSEFELAVTPDLETEYNQALSHPKVPSYVKDLLRNLLSRCTRRGFFGFDGPPWAGFDEGAFASQADIDAIDKVPLKHRSTNPLPRNRTDSHLVALSETEFVITADDEQIRRWGKASKGLVVWRDLDASLRSGRGLVEFLRKRASGFKSSKFSSSAIV